MRIGSMWRALVVGALVLAGAGEAAAQNRFWYQRGSNAPLLLEAPAQSFNLQGASPSGILVQIPYGSSQYVNVGFQSGPGRTLAPGAFEGAATYSSSSSPAVNFWGSNVGCYANGARYTVLEAVWDNNQLVRFAADFELFCDGGGREYGELRLGSSLPLTVEKPAGVTTPNAFAFGERHLLLPGAEVQSNETTVYGITSAAPISVAGATYSINGGPFTTSAGVVQNRDRVRLRATAPSTYDAVATPTLTVGGASAAFRISTYTTASPVTVLRLEGTPNDQYFSGAVITTNPPDYGITAQKNEGTVTFNVSGPGTSLFTQVAFASDAPNLLAGPYENAEFAAFRGAAPGVSLLANHRVCTGLAGRFVVLEAAYTAGTVDRFAADFELTCDGPSTTPVYGEIRYNSTFPITVVKPSGTTTPNPFAFDPAVRATAGSLVVSGATTIYGINAPASIGVTGGEYSINGGAFTSSPGTVQHRDRVRVRTTASPTAGGVAIATLDVDGVQAAFNVTTYAPSQPLTGLSFDGSSDDSISPATLVEAISPGWRITVRKATASEIVVDAVGPGGPSYSVRLAAPSGATLAPGVYEDAVQAYGPVASPSVDFSGNGRACSTVNGRFIVREYELLDGGGVRAAIDFEQSCQFRKPSFGELRIASTVPLRRYEPANSTTPNLFRVAARAPAAPGAITPSLPFSVFGMNAPAPITVSGGEYSVNGGAFTSSAGNVVHGDRVVVRVTAGLAAGDVRQATITIGGVVQTFEARTFAPGMRYTAAVIHGSASFLGRHIEAFPGDWRIYALSSGVNGLMVDISGPDSQFHRLNLAAPTGTPLVAGAYEDAQDMPLSHQPRMGFHPCSMVRGRFTVFEYELAGSDVSRFAANFEIYCGGAGPIFVEVRINSDIPILAFKQPGVSTPDPFALRQQGVVQAGEIAVSNAVRLFGTNAPIPLSITDGEYSVNGGPYTSSPGTAANGDLVVVRLVAPASGATRTASLTTGGRSTPFAVTAFQSGTQPINAFAYRSSPGDFVGGGLSYLHVPPQTPIASDYPFMGGARILVSGVGEVRIRARNGEALVPGMYENAVELFGDYARPGISIIIAGRTCNTVATGRFVVHEIAYQSPGGTVSKLAADVEYRCGPAAPPLFAEVRYNSAIPVSLLTPGACGRDTDGDGIDDCLEWDQQRNPFVRDNDVFADARLFAEQVYRDFLAREGDAAGVDFWAGRIASGAVTRGAVIEQFLSSPEFGGVVAPVARLYFAYFLRIPDKAGLDFWVDFRLAGNPMESISNAFAGSAEFASTYGALDNASFVDRVYRNVLGRAPDPAGLAYWRGELDAGRMTRGQVMLAFSESPEYTGITTNEIFVVMTYLAMLQRAPDAAGFAFWVDYMDKGNSGLALIDGFLGAVEYRNRFLP